MIAQGGFERMHGSFESKFLCFGRVASVVLVRRCDSSEVGMEMINLPGLRWATIKQVALDRLSRSLHSDVCDSDGCNDVVVHSTISGRGGRRERATLNKSSSKFLSFQFHYCMLRKKSFFQSVRARRVRPTLP